MNLHGRGAACRPLIKKKGKIRRRRPPPKKQKPKEQHLRQSQSPRRPAPGGRGPMPSTEPLDFSLEQSAAAISLPCPDFPTFASPDPPPTSKEGGSRPAQCVSSCSRISGNRSGEMLWCAWLWAILPCCFQWRGCESCRAREFAGVALAQRLLVLACRACKCMLALLSPFPSGVAGQMSCPCGSSVSAAT
jgi:hypothetical protein